MFMMTTDGAITTDLHVATCSDPMCMQTSGQEQEVIRHSCIYIIYIIMLLYVYV